MMCYDAIFFDADETLFDFQAAERLALTETCEAYGFPCPEEVLKQYSEINKSLWSLYEKGEMTQAVLRVRRFERLFDARGGAKPDCAAFNADYTRALGRCGVLLPGAKELVQALYPVLPLYIVTNGLAVSQRLRLERSPIKPYIREMFISEELGVGKPARAFFDLVFARLPAGMQDRRRILLFGDSLTSDMRGGRDSGLTTCWYNPHHLPANDDCDFVVTSLAEFPSLALA